MHHLLDLARFLIPWWTVIPRSWHSSLFEHNAGESTKAVCSSLVAEAFSEVDFPILPLIQEGEKGGYRLFRRNPRLYTPRDFDYSPFFDVIKCPLLRSQVSRWGKPRAGYYRKLVWLDYPDKDDDMHDLVAAHDVLHIKPDDADENNKDSEVLLTPIDELDEQAFEDALQTQEAKNLASPDRDGE